MAVWDQMQFKSAARRGCDAEALHEFELLIGATLPGDYRDFLLAVNGGAPESGTLYEQTRGRLRRRRDRAVSLRAR